MQISRLSVSCLLARPSPSCWNQSFTILPFFSKTPLSLNLFLFLVLSPLSLHPFLPPVQSSKPKVSQEQQTAPLLPIGYPINVNHSLRDAYFQWRQRLTLSVARAARNAGVIVPCSRHVMVINGKQPRDKVQTRTVCMLVKINRCANIRDLHIALRDGREDMTAVVSVCECACLWKYVCPNTKILKLMYYINRCSCIIEHNLVAYMYTQCALGPDQMADRRRGDAAKLL